MAPMSAESTVVRNYIEWLLDMPWDEKTENKNTLKESEEEETSGASAEKPTDEIVTPEPKDDDGAELSEEEISKLSPRAQKRIRELADKVKELAEQPEKEKEIVPPVDDKEKEISHDFKNVKEFLDAVQDEPSRKLLEKFYNVIKGEMSETLSPIETANNKLKFETEFAKYENVEGLKDYKNDLMKTFLRDPSQSFKALIGETIADLQVAKVKPVEKTPSSPNRGGKVNLDDLSLSELYDTLEQTKG